MMKKEEVGQQARKSKNRAMKVITAGAIVLMMLQGPAGAYGAAAGRSDLIEHANAGQNMQKPAGKDGSGIESSAQRKRMAIIIDDAGNDMKGTAEMLAMPAKLTVAVMPFLSTTKKDAFAAHEKGMDVIVHMPMEPKKGRPEWLGPGAITSGLSDEEVRERVEKAIDDVPYAIGMNNHMGSKITSDKRIMSVVLDVCRERGLFFVDSRTNFRSIVGELAVQKNMPPIGNDIFLDDRNTQQHIRKQMNAAVKHALDKTNCVVIGHVGHTGMNTSAVVREAMMHYKGQVEFVGIGDLAREVWSWNASPTQPTDKK